MLSNTILNSISFTALDVIFLILCIIILFLVYSYIKTNILKCLKILLFVLSIIFACSLIVSSIVFFYKTYMLRMLIPLIIGVLMLLVEFMIYVLIFEEKEVG